MMTELFFKGLLSASNAVTYSTENSPIKVDISALADTTIQLSFTKARGGEIRAEVEGDIIHFRLSLPQ
jgi:hypothetical protein